MLVVALLSAMTISKNIAQEQPYRLINQKSAGILIEYGLPYYFLPEGDMRYHVLLVGGNLSIPFFKTSKVFNVSVDIYPHAGFVWLKDCHNKEFGLNVRLGLNFAVSDLDVISLKIASGPHYIDCETEKQASGFIFSDYYLACYRRGFRISKEEFIFDFEFGYRHISNAGIKEPNRSISNFIFGLGLYKTF